MNSQPRKRRKNNFIDNKEFYAALVTYRKQCHTAAEAGEETPIIPRYIGKCFLDIAEHLSMRPNFSNYMYRQDMVMDAVENCVLYCKNFDQIEICDKIISKSGFEELFQADALGSSADYNSIKDAIDQRRRGNK